MATFNRFYSFSQALGQKKHNLESDTIRVMLTNSAPVLTNTVKADITEISAGGGYTANGLATTVTPTNTSGQMKYVFSDVTFTATTGFGPFRYAVVFNDTATNKELIGFIDHGANVTLGALESYVVDFDGTNGAITVG